ncbi:50S ribosomal protein L29 [Patescibacteria group bacterium]
MVKLKDLRSYSEKELVERLKKEKAFLSSMHFQEAKGRAKDVKASQKARRSIARILTILKESQHAK